MTAPLGNLWGSKRTFWNTGLKIERQKGRLASRFGGKPKESMTPIHAFVAPGYVVTREAYERVGGWPSALRNWGQTEVTLSLKLFLAGVPMYVMKEGPGGEELRIWHQFRESGQVPYGGMSSYAVMRNNYVMCRMCFEETFESFWLPLMQQGEHWKDPFVKVWQDPCDAERAAYQSVRVLSDNEFFDRVLGTTVGEAQGAYLAASGQLAVSSGQ